MEGLWSSHSRRELGEAKSRVSLIDDSPPQSLWREVGQSSTINMQCDFFIHVEPQFPLIELGIIGQLS